MSIPKLYIEEINIKKNEVSTSSKSKKSKISNYSTLLPKLPKLNIEEVDVVNINFFNNTFVNSIPNANNVNILDYLVSLPESNQLKELITTLLPHQKQGLGWLLLKENPEEPTTDKVTQFWIMKGEYY